MKDGVGAEVRLHLQSRIGRVAFRARQAQTSAPASPQLEAPAPPIAFAVTPEVHATIGQFLAALRAL